MAPNQFATMLHRRANKMTTILVYAFLEWVLIVLLLLNCLFYYIIRKFAKRFGLKPPCLLCSRVEHLLDPHNNTKTPFENFMCEAHATENSSTNYSPSQHKLTEFSNLCTNCLAFQHIGNGKIIKSSPKVAVFERLGKDIAKNDDGNSKCSGCDDVLSSCLLLKPSWDILEHAQKTYLIAEVLQDKDGKNEKWNISKSDMQEHCSEGSQVDERPNLERVTLGEAIEAFTLRLKPYFHSDVTIRNTSYKYMNAKSSDNATNTTRKIRNGDEESVGVMNRFSQISENSDSDQSTLAELFNNPTVRSQRSDIHVKGYSLGLHDDLLGDNGVNKLTDHSPVKAEGNTCLLFGDEITSQTSINEVLPNQGVLEFVQVNSSFNDNEEIRITAELSATNFQINQGPEELKKWEVEEAERWDGSIMSELEVDVGASTTEKLKSVSEAEHNALRSLQAELEEERNAAAIAANQAMAMITRLQEEKSAMQMEALHYQRMMEEQSEYDQEALQILNDLIIKRDKEKLELERDLEAYQKKVLDYEGKEKMMMISNGVRNINSSSSSSNIDEDDELFIDFYHEETVDDHCDRYNTGELVSEIEENGRECMKHLSILDESIAQFEDERVSILEELKALEGKLFTLADNDEETFEDRTLKYQDTYVYNREGFLEKQQAMGCTAKRLVPLFDATNFESEGEMNEEDAEYESDGNEISSVDAQKLEMKLSIEEEVDHVYRRLQALEADKEFLKHCFCSLKKGEKGRELLEEILERLCELRTVETQVRNRGDRRMDSLLTYCMT